MKVNVSFALPERPLPPDVMTKLFAGVTLECEGFQVHDNGWVHLQRDGGKTFVSWGPGVVRSIADVEGYAAALKLGEPEVSSENPRRRQPAPKIRSA